MGTYQGRSLLCQAARHTTVEEVHPVDLRHADPASIINKVTKGLVIVFLMAMIPIQSTAFASFIGTYYRQQNVQAK